MQETSQQYTARILGYQQGKKPLSVLKSTAGKLEKLIKKATKAQLRKRPQPDKWSVGEILAHLADTELVLGFRMRMILGANGTPIQAFDQNVWAEYSEYAKHDPQDSLTTFKVLREYNLRLLKIIPPTMWEHYGMHAERGKETIVRLIEMYAGHDINHVMQIENTVKSNLKKK